MIVKRYVFHKDRDDVIRIPAFVTKIDKSKAKHFLNIAGRLTDGIGGKSRYFSSSSEQVQSMRSSLLEHEALEYGYRLP